MHLVEIGVMEQRYQAVLAVVQDGWKVTEVADRLGVSRQSVHKWIARYEQGGLAALADRSHRPSACGLQIAPEIEAMICELRRRHPGLGGHAGPSSNSELLVSLAAWVPLAVSELSGPPPAGLRRLAA